MSYDRHAHRVLLFMLSDLWEWDGTDWARHSSAHVAPIVGGSMAFDIHRDVTVLWGNVLSPNDTRCARAIVPELRLSASLQRFADQYGERDVSAHGGASGLDRSGRFEPFVTEINQRRPRLSDLRHAIEIRHAHVGAEFMAALDHQLVGGLPLDRDRATMQSRMMAVAQQHQVLRIVSTAVGSRDDVMDLGVRGRTTSGQRALATIATVNVAVDAMRHVLSRTFGLIRIE